ncbi:MAG TPA: hypothetical protein VNW46_10250 [Gemmatimonadaceae bacterium]|jgi:hypothetical protein|nr:hypothetical protein [Gemmatimonadaceae bacterium]
MAAVRLTGVGAVVLAGLAGCAPPAPPLIGAPVPARALPIATLAAGRQRLLFHWEYRDREVSVNGDGSARIAPPDSARIDFVVSGSLGSGHALLLGDTVVAPGKDLVRRYLPPAPLVWAGLGRLAVPPARDTVVRVEGDTMRADIGVLGEATGHTPVWRVIFVGTRLVGAMRLNSGHIQERVFRRDDGSMEFESLAERRTLRLTRVRSESVAEFEPDVWRR